MKYPGLIVAVLFVVLLVSNTIQTIAGWNARQVLTRCVDTLPPDQKRDTLDQLWILNR